MSYYEWVRLGMVIESLSKLRDYGIDFRIEKLELKNCFMDF